MKTLRHSAFRLFQPSAFRLSGFFLAAFSLQAFSLQASGLSPGSGCYNYTDSVSGKTLNVWYYKPAEFSPQTPVLIVMHGMRRNAGQYRDSWVRHAQREKFMLLTPEFSEENFPKDSAYNMGNYRSPGGTINPREQWSFPIVERVFDDFIKSREKTDARQYYLYGHSAGSQFVHRFMLLVPEARVKLAICANAGFYTVPDFQKNWPHGIKETGLAQDSLRHYFSRPMVILLGEKDNDPKGANFPRGRTLDKQGITRFARGVYFFNFAQAAAEKAGVPFAWKMQVVPGAHHSDPLMSPAAMKLFVADMTEKKRKNSDK